MRIDKIGLYLPDVDSSQYEECFVLYIYIYIYNANATQIQLMQLQVWKLQM